MAAPIKKGVLVKRSRGKSAFGQLMPAWQPRLFVLTADSLTYYDESGEKVKDSIPLNEVLAVEAMSAAAFLKTNIFMVATPGTILYCHSESPEEYEQWLSSIRSAVGKTDNPQRLTSYHPGYNDGKKWNCCNDHLDSKGCKPTTEF